MISTKRSMQLILLLSTTTILACSGSPTSPESRSVMAVETVGAESCDISPPMPYKPSPMELEQDAIYTLLAYAVVYKDWQTTAWNDPENSRGYNIGGILVDPNQEPDNQLLCWARNSVIRTRNGTQHGEVRLLINYLKNVRERNAKGLKLYTTLEPCAMCSGMMTLQSLKTSIYGQTDPGFGGAIERLNLDSHVLQQGKCPYPRGVQSVASPLEIREQLDAAYAKAKDDVPNITIWLTSTEARSLYEQAVAQLMEFQVQFEENSKVLEQAHAFLENVPADYAATPYTVACQAP